MKDPLRRITVVFAVVAILPVAFLIYELNQLSQNEAIVRETYKNQLDAILYSVNQYSDDAIGSWANRIRMELRAAPDSADQLAARFQGVLNQVDVVPFIYLSDMRGRSTLISLTEQKAATGARDSLDALVVRERKRVEQLIRYEEAGFRKLDPINFQLLEQFIPVFFALDYGSEGYRIGAMLLYVPAFITQTLAPKLQSVSQEKFVISAFKSGSDSLIYTTQLTASRETDRQAEVTSRDLQLSKFWALPDYYLGIRLLGSTTDDLVRARNRNNLMIVGLFTVLSAAGIWFLYRNIRREMQLSQAKSEFVSNVSHEIRTPLSLIGMFAETLETGRVTTEEKKQEYYHIISKETARLTRIVNRILNFSQLEANRKSFRMAPVQLNDLCQEVLANYTDALKEKGFEVVYQPGSLPLVQADREAVAEVMVNVMDNAVKYSHERKYLAIQTVDHGNHVDVQITDKGIGIARQHHRDIFEQFFRAPLGDVHTTKGSGLGLTLVKKIMLAHGGDVLVDSEPGKGSTFTLRFPIQKNSTS
jgi:two-component system phosphate regulon sensor histidine kinase PhoR